MVSQKNTSLKHCIKCLVELTDINWLSYLVKRSNYICTPCFRQYGKQYHKSDLNYAQKQLNRYYARKSAVIHYYGDRCGQCSEDEYEKLTIDHINNNGATHRRQMTTNIFDYLYNNLIDRDGYQVLCYNCNCTKSILFKDKYHLKYKNKVIDAYGSGCAECKISDIKYLTIDHKNNDGADQRKKLKCGTGSKFYRWLIKNNFPDLGLQVLCYNCNCSKISKRLTYL